MKHGHEAGRRSDTSRRRQDLRGGSGIRLADKPSGLFVLALLLWARIAPPSVTMRQTSSAVTGLIGFASTTCPAKPAIDVAVSTAADGGTTETTSAHPVKSSTLCSPASAARLRVPVLRPAGSHTSA